MGICSAAENLVGEELPAVLETTQLGNTEVEVIHGIILVNLAITNAYVHSSS